MTSFNLMQCVDEYTQKDSVLEFAKQFDATEEVAKNNASTKMHGV